MFLHMCSHGAPAVTSPHAPHSSAKLGGWVGGWDAAAAVAAPPSSPRAESSEHG